MNTPESDFFITLEDRIAIVDLLREIPELIEDLAVTISRQDRLGTGGPQISSGSYKERPLVFNEFASDAADHLHGILGSWARYVLEERGSAAWPEDSTLTIARWLDHNVVSLAMTPGSEECLGELRDAVRRVRRAVDLPPEKVRSAVDDDELARARELAMSERVTAAQAERWVEILEYQPKKAETIRQWAKRGNIEKGEDGLYSLADILARSKPLERPK
ncbi:hypothetical protein G419_25252 [Rhodococcus triatomae BKS 15-14]|nr:hypothetical protein G419_25252 [Rhodococcus triatomae BKS 15-14]